jgi:hypothetical protein
VTNALRKTPIRLLSATAAALLSVGLLAGCSDDEATPSASGSPAASESPAADLAENITEFSYAGREGSTALELLQENDPSAEVSGEMAYVTAIQGRAAVENEEFWALYVDGEMAQVGAGALDTEDGQQVQWKLEKIEQ